MCIISFRVTTPFCLFVFNRSDLYLRGWIVNIWLRNNQCQLSLPALCPASNGLHAASTHTVHPSPRAHGRREITALLLYSAPAGGTAVHPTPPPAPQQQHEAVAQSIPCPAPSAAPRSSSASLKTLPYKFNTNKRTKILALAPLPVPDGLSQHPLPKEQLLALCCTSIISSPSDPCLQVGVQHQQRPADRSCTASRRDGQTGRAPRGVTTASLLP